MCLVIEGRGELNVTREELGDAVLHLAWRQEAAQPHKEKERREERGDREEERGRHAGHTRKRARERDRARESTTHEKGYTTYDKAQLTPTCVCTQNVRKPQGRGRPTRGGERGTGAGSQGERAVAQHHRHSGTKNGATAEQFACQHRHTLCADTGAQMHPSPGKHASLSQAVGWLGSRERCLTTPLPPFHAITARRR